jgi:hypothetical protein
MRTGMIVGTMILALAAAVAGCTDPARSTVEGETLYRVCGGAPPPPDVDPCQPPQPVTATVTVRRGGTVVARVRSDATGRFRLTLTRGSYTAQATLDPDAPFVNCPEVALTVPSPAPVTVTCTLLAP